jgi:predicted MFS family arabinose efflux permease
VVTVYCVTLVTDREWQPPSPVVLALAGTSVIAVAYGFARYGFGLFVPVFSDQFGLSLAAVGFISSAAYVSYLVAMTATGGLTARWGPRLPIAAGAGCAAVGMTVVAAAREPLALTIGVVVAAASSGLCWAPFCDVVAAHVRSSHRARVLSVVSTGTTFGLIVAGPAAWLASTHGSGWRLAWAGFALAAAACAVWNALVLPGGRATHPAVTARLTTATPSRPRRDRLTWMTRPGAGRLLGQSAAYGLVASVFFTFAVDLVTRAGLPTTWRLLLLTLVGVGGTSGIATGDAARRFGIRRCVTGCLLLLAAALAGLASAGHSSIVTTLAALGFGAAYMPIAALLALWSQNVYPDRPTTGFTVTLVALAAGSIAGPAIFGAFADSHGLPTTFLVLSGLTLASVILRPPPVP